MKKLLTILTSILLLCTMIPLGAIPVAAVATAGSTGDCTWVLDGTQLTIYGSGKGTMGDYTSYREAPWGTSITSVTIDKSVTTIGNYAFYWCRLTSVTIPDSVTTIGKCAFANCTRLTSVTMGDSITTINDFAFESCQSLTSVTIPDSVTTIRQYAFYDCTSLTSVTIPDNVTTIGGGAFDRCASLRSVTMGDNITTIGDYAFYGCDSLTDVYYIGNDVNQINIAIGYGNECLTDAIWHYICRHKYTYACDNICILCGEFTNPDATHNLMHIEPWTPTCCEPGNIEYWYCEDCDQFWLDADCTRATDQMSVILPTTDEHFYDDEYDAYCNMCGEWREVETPEIIYGDADGNGEVTIIDEALVSQYLAGWDVTLNEAAADVDGNGEVTIIDEALISQYLAGWDVKLG